MRKAMFTEGNKCFLCPHNCVIPEGKRGVCKVRVNKGGQIYSLVYSLPCSIAVDPVEKKPLYHFFPGEKIFSFGTFGCNFFCKGCQNYAIARRVPEETHEKEDEYHPKRIVEMAKEEGCGLIAYTYTEPTIFYEYAYETAKEAKKQGLKNVIVSNGYINEAPLRELAKYIDAANIDLKFFDEKSYLKYAGAKMAPVLKTIKLLKESGVWVEITNLMIPGWNDDMKEFEEMCVWIKENAGKDTPLHISRFFPYYQLEGKTTPTPIETLRKAEEIAKKHLDFVYVGNIAEESNTYCPKCNSLLIKRYGYHVESRIKKGECFSCSQKISGIW